MALESKVLMMTPEIGDGATFVQSSASSMAVGNIQKQQPTDRWRSDNIATTDAYFEMDFGDTYSFDFVSAMFHNGEGSSTWRVRTASALPILSNVTYDSSWLDCWESNAAMATAGTDFSGWQRKHSFHDIPTEQLRRYIRIDFSDATNSDGYFELGRFYVGLKWQPEINISFGSGLPWHHEEVKRVRTQGGLKFPVARPKEKRVNVTFQFQSESDLMNFLYEVSRVRGVSNDLMYIHNATTEYAVHQLVYGVTAAPVNVSIPALGIWTLNFSIEELL